MMKYTRPELLLVAPAILHIHSSNLKVYRIVLEISSPDPWLSSAAAYESDE